VNKPIYLTKDQVPTHLRGGYSGNKFSVQVCEEMTIPSTAGLWDGGSRDTFEVLRLADGKAIEPLARGLAPWDGARQSVSVTLEPGICVREHSILQGKDLGLRFYLHPAAAAAILPAAADLSELERMVLNATASLKSSYGGRDRYQMATDDLRYSGKPCPSRADWEAAKAALVGRGYLNLAGAITVAGKNAR
jgi:hypothetical protein